MKSLIQTLIALSIAAMLLGGCQKSEEAPADAPAMDAAPATGEQGTTAPAEPAPEAAPAEPGGWVPPAEEAAPAAPAEGAAPAAPAEEAK